MKIRYKSTNITYVLKTHIILIQLNSEKQQLSYAIVYVEEYYTMRPKH